MDYMRVACASLLAVVFAVSAVAKLRDLGGFARSLPALFPAGRAFARPLTAVITAAEAAVPFLLVIPHAAAYGFGLAAVLLVAFTVAIGSALRRGRRAPCRCFGASSAPVGTRHLGRNAALLAAAALGIPPPGTLPPAAGLAVAAGAGLVGAVLVVSLDDIIDLFARSS